MVLQSDVSRKSTVPGEPVHLSTVEPDGIELPRDCNFVSVPRADRLNRRGRGWRKAVDSARLVRRSWPIIYLDLVALVDRDPWIVAWIRKAHEDPRVVVRRCGHPVDLQHEVLVGPGAIPQKAHPSL